MKTLRKLNPSGITCRDCYLQKSYFKQPRIFLIVSENNVIQVKQPKMQK